MDWEESEAEKELPSIIGIKKLGLPFEDEMSAVQIVNEIDRLKKDLKRLEEDCQ